MDKRENFSIGTKVSLYEMFSKTVKDYPEYGSLTFKIVFHQGSIVRIETAKSVSEKIDSWT